MNDEMPPALAVWIVTAKGRLTVAYEDFIAALPVSFESDAEWRGRERRVLPASEYIEVEWIIGGQSGGDCWGSKSRPIAPAPEPEFVALDMVLEQLCPQISFLQYKAILRDCVAYGSHEENGYYGNSTEYARKRVGLRGLYDKLLSWGLVS